MDWLSGLKVIGNEQEQLFSENNLRGDGLLCSLSQLLVTQNEEKQSTH